MERFMVEDVMNTLREDIKTKKLCSSDLSYTTYYHRKLMQELRTLDSVVLFGAGKHGQIILDEMLQHDIGNVICYCDNKASGTLIRGIKVISPHEAINLYPEAYYVITPMDYQEEILVQLINMGIRIEHIRLCDLLRTGLIL